MLAPLIIFVYNRPEHTAKMIESLASNILASDTDVFIFSDAAKNENQQKNVRKTREYIDAIPDKNYFKSVEIIKAPENKGLAESVISGVDILINRYNKVIVVEDDLITTPDFLKFMNDSLDYYEANNKIWSISGYNLPIDIPKRYSKDIYISPRGSSWGWATWNDRWRKVDWQVSTYLEFKENFYKRWKFNMGGRDLSNMLDRQMKGEIDSWAIRWCYSQYILRMYTVYPVISKIKNIGIDGSGTHSRNTNRFNVNISNTTQKYQLEDVKINWRILKNFRSFYLSLPRFLLSEIKRIANRKMK